MTSMKWFLGLSAVLCAACTHASGALGPQGYEQSLTKYRLNYADAARQKFLPDDWQLDNYSYDPSGKKWTEKKGFQYRAERRLDEDGDGTVSSSERKEENIFDLRFVHSRDNAVIWLKVHPLEPNYANVDLDVILENYVDGLEGSGIFEQSTLFGLEQDKARHFTTFMVKKESTSLGALPAIRGVIEIADVEKLRIDAKHRDSKSELVFAKVVYLENLGNSKPSAPRWPIVTERVTNQDNRVFTRYNAQRTGLLVIGYYDDAGRFDSHLADLHAMLGQVVIPDSAVPPNSAPPVLTATSAPAPAPSASAPPASAPPASAPPASAPSASAPPASAPPASAPPAPSAAPAPTTPPAPKSAPAAPQTAEK